MPCPVCGGLHGCSPLCQFDGGPRGSCGAAIGGQPRAGMLPCAAVGSREARDTGRRPWPAAWFAPLRRGLLTGTATEVALIAVAQVPTVAGTRARAPPSRTLAGPIAPEEVRTTQLALVQHRDRGTALHHPGHRQEARQPAPHEVRRPRPGAAHRHCSRSRGGRATPEPTVSREPQPARREDATTAGAVDRPHLMSAPTQLTDERARCRYPRLRHDVQAPGHQVGPPRGPPGRVASHSSKVWVPRGPGPVGSSAPPATARLAGTGPRSGRTMRR